MSYDHSQMTALLVRCVRCGVTVYATHVTTPEDYVCVACRRKAQP